MYYASACLIIQDDQDYIQEWIEYYLLIGVDHFYLADNNSNPRLKTIIQDYIDQGLITYHYDTREKPQIVFYNECIKKYQNESKWLLFFDSDEFLLLKQHQNLKAFLSPNTKISELYLSVGFSLDLMVIKLNRNLFFKAILKEDLRVFKLISRLLFNRKV